MSLGKRIAEAIDKMANHDPEGALYQIASAIDATAKAEYGVDGKKTYKQFIHENLPLISRIGFGQPVANIHLGYSHPKIKPVSGGSCTLQDIFYHAVRCGLFHDAKMPPDIEFTTGASIDMTDPAKIKPNSNLIHGLIIAVVVAPVNGGEKIGENYKMCLNTESEMKVLLKIDSLWGRRSEVEWLLNAMR